MLMGSLIGCKKQQSLSILSIIQEESYFDSFEIRNEKVYFDCKIKIKNNSNDPKKFQIIGDFTDEREKKINS